MQLVREVSNVFLFSIMTIILLAITYIYNEFLISDRTYYNTFAEQLTAEKIDGAIEQVTQGLREVKLIREAKLRALTLADVFDE